MTYKNLELAHTTGDTYYAIAEVYTTTNWNDITDMATIAIYRNAARKVAAVKIRRNRNAQPELWNVVQPNPTIEPYLRPAGSIHGKATSVHSLAAQYFCRINSADKFDLQEVYYAQAAIGVAA